MTSVCLPLVLQSAKGGRQNSCLALFGGFRVSGFYFFLWCFIFVYLYVLLRPQVSTMIFPSPSLLFRFFSIPSRQTQLKEQAQQALVSPGNLPEEAECLTVPKYKRDLVQKLKILRQELSQQQPQAGHCRIEVSREEIFEVRPSN